MLSWKYHSVEENKIKFISTINPNSLIDYENLILILMEQSGKSSQGHIWVEFGANWADIQIEHYIPSSTFEFSWVTSKWLIGTTNTKTKGLLPLVISSWTIKDMEQTLQLHHVGPKKAPKEGDLYSFSVSTMYFPFLVTVWCYIS